MAVALYARVSTTKQALLTGLMKCGTCGAGMTLVTGHQCATETRSKMRSRALRNVHYLQPCSLCSSDLPMVG